MYFTKRLLGVFLLSTLSLKNWAASDVTAADAPHGAATSPLTRAPEIGDLLFLGTSATGHPEDADTHGDDGGVDWFTQLTGAPADESIGGAGRAAADSSVRSPASALRGAAAIVDVSLDARPHQLVEMVEVPLGAPRPKPPAPLPTDAAADMEARVTILRTLFPPAAVGVATDATVTQAKTLILNTPSSELELLKSRVVAIAKRRVRPTDAQKARIILALAPMRDEARLLYIGQFDALVAQSIDKAETFLQLLDLPPELLIPVVAQTARFKNRNRVMTPIVQAIRETLTRKPADAIEVVTQTLNIMAVVGNDTPSESIAQIIGTLRDIITPYIHGDLPSIVAESLKLMRKNMLKEDVTAILTVLSTMENRANVSTQTLRLLFGARDLPGAEIAETAAALASVPKEELVVCVDQGLRFKAKDPDLNRHHIVSIVKTLGQIRIKHPVVHIDTLVTQALKLTHDEMNHEGINHILNILADTNHFERVTDQVLKLLESRRGQESHMDIGYMLQAAGSIQPERLITITAQVLKFETRAFPFGSVISLMSALFNVPYTTVDSTVKCVLELKRIKGYPLGEVIRLIEIFATVPEDRIDQVGPCMVALITTVPGMSMEDIKESTKQLVAIPYDSVQKAWPEILAIAKDKKEPQAILQALTAIAPDNIQTVLVHVKYFMEQAAATLKDLFVNWFSSKDIGGIIIGIHHSLAAAPAELRDTITHFMELFTLRDVTMAGRPQKYPLIGRVQSETYTAGLAAAAILDPRYRMEIIRRTIALLLDEVNLEEEMATGAEAKRTAAALGATQHAQLTTYTGLTETLRAKQLAVTSAEEALAAVKAVYDGEKRRAEQLIARLTQEAESLHLGFTHSVEQAKAQIVILSTALNEFVRDFAKGLPSPEGRESYLAQLTERNTELVRKIAEESGFRQALKDMETNFPARKATALQRIEDAKAESVRALAEAQKPLSAAEHALAIAETGKLQAESKANAAKLALEDSVRKYEKAHIAAAEADHLAAITAQAFGFKQALSAIESLHPETSGSCLAQRDRYAAYAPAYAAYTLAPAPAPAPAPTLAPAEEELELDGRRHV